MSGTLGFLHTASVHEATFSGLVDELAPGTSVVHVVDESLLTDARARGGVDDLVRTRLVGRLRELAASADVVVCTCSTISGAAETLADQVAVPVVRLDRPMAEAAVGFGSDLAVVAALASTLGPTTELLRSVASAAGVAVRLTEYPCVDAWDRFERGDQDGYLDAIAECVDSVSGPVDAIVLAQASMAGAAARCRRDVPVLTSPRLAVERALQVVGVR